MHTGDKKLLFLATGVYLIVLLLSQLISSGSAPLPARLDPALAMIGAQVVFILFPALLFAWIMKLPFRETFKFHPLSLKQAAKHLLLGFLVWPIFQFLSSFSLLVAGVIAPEKLNAATNAVSQGVSPWLIFLSIAFIAPICEEIFFRGMLLSVYEKFFGLAAVWPVGILFGLLHLSYDQVLGAVFVGCLAGWLVIRTRSVWPGVLVHMGCNLISGFLILVMSSAAGGPEVAPPALDESSLQALLLAATLVWGIIALIFMVPVGWILRGVKNHRSVYLLDAQ